MTVQKLTRAELVISKATGIGNGGKKSGRIAQTLRNRFQDQSVL